MPRAEAPPASGAEEPPPTSSSTADAAQSSPLLPWQRVGRSSQSAAESVCTCRCSSKASGMVVFGIFALVATSTVAFHSAGGWTSPPPQPWIDLPTVVQCGTWPDYIPCRQCLYGADPAKRYRVQPGDKCADLSKKLGVPQFDLLIRNRSLSCCEMPNPMPGELIDVCDAPTREQWKADGHPRRPPSTGVVASFLGSASHGFVGLPPGEHLPDSMNVVMLFPTNDVDSKGNFQVDPKFASQCDTLIDPTRPQRHDSRHNGDFEDERVWQFSLGTGAGRWSTSIPADDWGKSGAAALEKIILRYRLDGIDVNIESPRSPFANYMCALFKHLKEIDPDLVITVTPYQGTWSRAYKPLGSQCGELVTWVNYQSYSDLHFGTNVISGTYADIAKTYGKGADDWSKVCWGASTQIGNPRPTPAQGHTLMSTLQSMHAEARGVFVWTSEYSARSKPPWCFENQMAQVMKGEQPSGTCSH